MSIDFVYLFILVCGSPAGRPGRYDRRGEAYVDPQTDIVTFGRSHNGGGFARATARIGLRAAEGTAIRLAEERRSGACQGNRGTGKSALPTAAFRSPGRSFRPARRCLRHLAPAPSISARPAMYRPFLRRPQAAICSMPAVTRALRPDQRSSCTRISPFQTVADLKGKRVAFKRGSSAHNFTVKALRKAGLGITDIEAADLSPSDAAAAFASNKVDAWSIWDPYFAVAEKDPNTRVLTTAEGIVEAWSYFLSNGDFTAAHGDVLGDILDELAKVGAAAQADLNGTVAALSKITGVPEDIQRVALTRKGFSLADVSTLGPDAVAYQQALADEFFQLQIIPKQLTISDIVWKGRAS